MFISFFTGKVMLFYGISLIMKEKSNASALGMRYARTRDGVRRKVLATGLGDRMVYLVLMKN